MGRTEATELIKPYTISTLKLPVEQQFDYWRSAASTVMDVTSPEYQAKPGFDAVFEGYDLRSMIFASGKTDAELYERSHGHTRSDLADHWILELRKTGSAVSRSGDRILKSPAGCLEVRSMARPYRGRSTRTTGFYCYLPRSTFPGLAQTMDSLDHTVLRGTLAELLKEYLNGVERHLPNMTATEIPSVVEATTAIIVACISQSRTTELEASVPIQVARLEKARQFIEASLQSQELGPDMICKALGMSRRQLYYLFEPSGGVAAYIRRRRLRASHAVVVNVSQLRRIQTIAYDHGFSDPALFSRLFKAQFGYSPKEAREAAASGVMYREALPSTVAEWLGHQRFQLP